jgi:hypothetical protein
MLLQEDVIPKHQYLNSVSTVQPVFVSGVNVTGILKDLLQLVHIDFFGYILYAQ